MLVLSQIWQTIMGVSNSNGGNSNDSDEIDGTDEIPFVSNSNGVNSNINRANRLYKRLSFKLQRSKF